MGTITERRLKDGSIVYTAQVRIMRDGKKASASSTFERRSAAEAWLRRKEAELKKPGGFEKMERQRTGGATLAEAIDTYARTSTKQIGKTKAQVLKSIKSFEIASLPCAAVTSQKLVEFAQELFDGGRQPQTIGNYLSHLSAIFAIAEPAWKIPLDPAEMRAATTVCKNLGLIGKSKKRDRRPTLEEMNKLMAHFEDRWRKGRALPMHKVCAFAIFSTRRQEEIVSITWADLEAGRVLVRDMKHPGEKEGNDIWVDLPPEAERIVKTMPAESSRIFPYTTDAVSTAFTRACKLLGIKDLHFHDLRHEGVSRLFEMGKTIPQAASVSGHRSWPSLQRYSHLRATGDKWAGWKWLDKIAPPAPS
ncbi:MULTISPECIES: site-specific integrase [unclassified Paracoccus (in: a-proteobacteria)]|uniref:site-specific integrase n=1 Tax=unclassified Paracoccus (in: a-proteobacteria) TaxID=2688777 RepID=UPI00048E4D8C|nr:MULTISPECIES: site-specific integrase [unclassified Paracoccus (in: a-proteobacteria)]